MRLLFVDAWPSQTTKRLKEEHTSLPKLQLENEDKDNQKQNVVDRNSAGCFMNIFIILYLQLNHTIYIYIDFPIRKTGARHYFAPCVLLVIMCIDKHLWLALQEHFSRPGLSGCDVYDGQLYQKHDAFVSHPANVTLLLNTDMFRSSKSTLWPVWLIINELPKRLRYEYTVD